MNVSKNASMINTQNKDSSKFHAMHDSLQCVYETLITNTNATHNNIINNDLDLDPLKAICDVLTLIQSETSKINLQTCTKQYPHPSLKGSIIMK